MAYLQTNQISTSLGCISIVQPQQKESWISLHDKLDGRWSKFQGLVNQMHLVIRFHLHRYPTGLAQVGLIGTLLSSIALVWFIPSLEHQSPLFNEFEIFLEEFNATFGNLDKECTSNIKI